MAVKLFCQGEIIKNIIYGYLLLNIEKKVMGIYPSHPSHLTTITLRLWLYYYYIVIYS